MANKTFRRPDGEAMARLLAQHPDTCEGLILRLAWNMGLSLDEMNGLQWADILFEAEELRVPGRSVPLDADTAACLQLRKNRRFHEASDYVVISDRRRAHMHRVYISRTAQTALNTESALADLTLKDLREDFVLRQLEVHDSAYVARISGLTLTTVNGTYLPAVSYEAETLPSRRGKPGSVDAAAMRKLVLDEGVPAGLAIWLVWRAGLELEEIAALEWRQVDRESGILSLRDRQEPIDGTMAELLEQAESLRCPDMPQVLLSRNARTPFDVTYLSRVTRMALIRGGMEQVKLRDLKRAAQRHEADALLLEHAERRGGITRNEAVDFLQENPASAYRRLHRLTEQGRLVRIGAEYYPADSVVPPEEHYRVIRDYLEAEGGAYRQELADLLRIGAKQCGWILQTMVDDGRLNRSRQWYTLPEGEQDRN